MGGKKGNKSKKSKTKAQKAAAARHAKFKQTRVQTFGGKRTSFSKSEQKRIKAAGYSVKGYSKAAPNKASGYSGTTGVSIGSKIKNPNPKTTFGVGPVASGSDYANMLKASPPRFNEAGRNELSSINQNIATNYGDLGSGYQNILQNQYKAFDKQGLGEKELKRLQKMYPGFTPRASINDGTMLASERKINPFNIFQTREALKEGEAAREGRRDTVDNPGLLDRILNRTTETQKEIDKASLTTPTFGLTASTSPMAIRTYGTGGITEDASSASGFSRDGTPLTKTEAMSTFGIGGLNLNNIGGTDRAVTSDTSEQRADRYRSTLNPDSFKGLSDGETFGSGPVASGEDYARGLNVSPYGSVENTMRSIVGKVPLINRIPIVKDIVNTRLLTDKEIADKRVSAQNQLAYRKEMAKFRGGASGGNRLPVTPTVIEEVIPEALPVPSASTTPTTQTGVDPNRLLQIQQQAYAQAYNPMLIGGFNPQFRFGAATPTIDYSTYFNY